MIEDARPEDKTYKIEFYLKATLEFIQLIRSQSSPKTMSSKDSIITAWCVHAQEDTIDVLTQVFTTASSPPATINLDIALLDKCHNLGWMVLSKLAKTNKSGFSRFITRDKMLPFISAAVNQLSSLFGMT